VRALLSDAASSARLAEDGGMEDGGMEARIDAELGAAGIGPGDASLSPARGRSPGS
jgi:hypothetical protein